MGTESLKRAKKKYNASKVINKSIQLYRTTDADIIEYISHTDEPFGTMVKRLVRLHIKDPE